MTPEQLDAIEARANAATPGPWRVWYSSTTIAAIEAADRWIVEGSDGHAIYIASADAAFIGAARTDVPALVAEVRRLQTWIEELTRDPWETPPDNLNTSMLEILDRWTQIEKLVGNPTPQWVYDEIARRTEYGYQYEPAERLKIIDGVVRDIAMGRLP